MLQSGKLPKTLIQRQARAATLQKYDSVTFLLLMQCPGRIL